MEVEVKLFAMLRAAAGSDSVSLDLEEGSTVDDALRRLRSHESLGDLVGRMPVRMAVNRDYADRSTVLAEGDELALIPPVSGGSGAKEETDLHARITGDPIDSEAVTRRVARPGAGAVVSFQGTTRDVDRLEYEAYAEMAQEKMQEILRSCKQEHGLEAVAAEHRVGAVPLGEASVVVAVSAAHRDEAFAGAREAIDRIKAEAPIWKREVEGSDERWVEGQVPE